MTSTVLVCTLHDPHADMEEQTRRVLPTLGGIFARVCVRASETTHPELLELLQAAGAAVDNRPAPAGDGKKLGLARSEAVALGLQTRAQFLLYCDFDRALHWAEHYPAELAKTAELVQAFDFTVLGRTPRAWQTHPRVQRDTEGIINEVFRLVTGQGWDVGAGARGLSQRAAQAILTGCHDENLSTDVTWPLYLRDLDPTMTVYTQTCILTEGLEFETPDRHTQAVQAAGGTEAWLEQFDADPLRWVERLELAGGHLRAMLPYMRR